jgi:glycosyltransferase involved in cell wall biosynthesis
MNILQVSTMDHGGGAAKVPWDLFRAYRDQDHRSMLAVGYRRGVDRDDPDIFEIPNDRYRSVWSRSLYAIPAFLQQRGLRGETRLRHLSIPLGEPKRGLQRMRGIEDFDFPATPHLLDLAPEYPDVVHCHNLHGDYFDLRALAQLSQQLPVMLTLHDMWTLTGHCAYSLSCTRWQSGCGNCPDLSLYPAIPVDETARNWSVKREIYGRSRLYVSAPCHWVMNMVKRSMLQPVDYRVIPYGVDLQIFRPIEKQHARRELGLPIGTPILLFAGSRANENRYKDYATIEATVQLIAAQTEQDLIFIDLGGRHDYVSTMGRCRVHHYAFRGRQEDVARFYQAADVFIHAANADTFPNTILEALACGTPVVATAVGGIPEQIDEGTTGFLVPHADAPAMAQHVRLLLADAMLRGQMALRAAEIAAQKYDLRRQVRDYLSWYEEIVIQNAEAVHAHST